MSIGLYDADMAIYGHTAPNLELMKLAAYYKKNNEIVTLTPNFFPSQYSKYIYQKDYNDGLFPRKFTTYANLESGGLSFSNNIYKPMSSQKEAIVPDTSIYEVMQKYFWKNKNDQITFNACLNAQHLRLSLDGKTIWKDYKKQISTTHEQNFFFHDINLNEIENSAEEILTLVQDCHKKSSGFISVKFPIKVYCFEDLKRWLQLKWSSKFFSLEYYGTMETEEFKYVIQCCKGTQKLCNIQYIVTHGFKDQQDFVDNGIEKIYDQLMLACSNRQKFLLKYEDNFFIDKQWEDIFTLWKSYNSILTEMKPMFFEKYRGDNSLFKVVKRFHDIKKTRDIFSKKEARELFSFVRQNNYPLFCKFYEKNPIEIIEKEENK